MIGLAATTYDLVGALLLEVKTGLTIRDMDRRITRTKTLDGGVSVEDNGLSHGDRTFKIVLSNVAKETADTLQYLTEQYSELIVTTDEGAFLAVIRTYRYRRTLTLTIIIKEKLTA